MQSIIFHHRVIIFSIALLLFCIIPTSVSAHCDTMNGPVVLAAKQALETGNVNFVLIWVRKDDEAAIRDVFQRTLKVRGLSSEAKSLADMYFFETVVRIHRTGEGVAYSGLKPAETEIDPGIAAADHAVETGNADELVKHLKEALHSGITEQFTKLRVAQKYNPNDLDKGRAYVQAYVTFIHYVESVFLATKQSGSTHLHEGSDQQEHHDQH